MPSRLRLAICAACLFAFFSGCAAHSSKFAPIESALRRGDANASLAALEATNPPDRDLLVYELDRASILQYGGFYKESLGAYENAKQLVREYDAASVSEQIGSALINDATIAYYGEDFERVYINFYAALAYLSMGDLYGARVEMAQADARLKTLEGDYDDDAATRYLSGAIYEALGENSDALVSYRQAYRSYLNGYGGVGVPDSLKRDLLRLAKRMKIADEHRKYREEFGDISGYDRLGKDGELIAIVSVGFAPIKRSDEMTVMSSIGLISIALPRYEFRPFSSPIALIVDQNATVPLELIADMSVIAQEALSAKMPEITARAIARIVAKKATEEAAGAIAGGGDNKGGGAAALAKFAMSLFNAATEVADTRSWLTLPDKIYFARVKLPAGDHKISIGGIEYDAAIASGKRLFIAARIF